MLLDPTRNALLKLVAANSGTTNMLSTPLMAAALAARVLQHFEIPFVARAGYVQDTGVSKSVPHVWLETPNPEDEDAPLITDLTLFSDGLRAVHLLGMRTALREEVLIPTFTAKPMFAVDYRSVALSTLQLYAADLEGYVASYLDHLKDDSRRATVAFIVRTLTDAYDELITNVTVQNQVHGDAPPAAAGAGTE